MGNDELHESDVFFERRVPLAYNFTWSTQFLMFAARPPSDLPEGWQERWLERLDAQASGILECSHGEPRRLVGSSLEVPSSPRI